VMQADPARVVAGVAPRVVAAIARTIELGL
jgi:hypothetical protein